MYEGDDCLMSICVEKMHSIVLEYDSAKKH